MAEELKPCPFCGCSMRLESNRDWHRIVGDHALECAFTDSETMVVPATKEQRDIAVSDWNTRAIHAGHVVVSEGLLRRIVTPALTSSDAQDRIGALEELRALLSEQEGRKP
ncbi:Lar family restriction alleviation protein [Pseudomonas aeruginosa]|uniref:Lar family restriction alleviation protein n=1 Tax=Pseudomonas aeruginosa TaxID=287 RepID=UPI0009A30F0A|nr:Lar family restriction alleviation protein [Pseudomonas aeruginosa]